MILSTHGIVSSISGVDADWLAYYNRVIADGGSLTTTEQSATLQLVLDLKANSLWTPMKAIYPMVGGGTGSTAAREAACAQNLKSASFTGSFSTGWTFASTGVTPNGTSAYFDTFLTPSTGLSSINNLHLSMYSRTQNSSVSGHNMGDDQGSNNLNLTQYFSAVNNKLFMNGAYPTYASLSNTTNTKGLILGSVASSTSRKLFFNGSLLNTTTSTTPGNLPNTTLLIGCGRNGITGVADYFTPHENAFASIGDGLTDTQASDFYTAVQAFQDALNREV
jgi:hypothetical protein